MRLRNFRCGDIIVTSLPFAAVLQPRLAGRYCDECYNELTKPITTRCPNCPFVNYCGSNCRERHRPYHSSFECDILNAFIPQNPDVTFRLFIKLLYRIQDKELSEFEEPLFTGEKRTFADLLDHRENICNQPVMFTKFRTYFALIDVTFPDNMKPSFEFALQIYGKMMINRFSIQNHYLEPIGEALYIAPSIHDHSCLPDATFTFNGSELTIRAMRDLSVTDPREIYICYTDILQPLDDRLSYLEEHYFFRCRCFLCTQPDHPINNIRTTKENLRDSLRDALLACNPTDGNRPDPCLEAIFERSKFYIEEDDEHERAAGKSELKYWKLDAIAVAFECAARLGIEEDAYLFGTRLLSLYRETYGDRRPCFSVLSLRVAECSKCKGQEVYERAMLEARKKLKLTHGLNHPLCKRCKP